MLDIKFIRENAEKMKEVCKNKNINLDIDELLDLDKKRREFIQKSEEIKSEQKKLGKDDREQACLPSHYGQAKKLKDEFKKLDSELKIVKEKYNELMLLVPNVYSENTPIGSDESDNKEIYKWGKIPEFDFPIKDHLQIGKDLDLIDIEKGVKTSGFRGYYLKNEAALLQFALMSYALEKLRKKGFTIMIPPTILREFALIGSGHFPEGKDEVYQIANPGRLADGKEMKEKFYLSGTSESALLAYYANTVLEEKKLPVKLAGFSQCYRSEVGSYGKDAKGLYRLHEFMKIEQVILCQADLEKSDQLFEEMGKNAQEILKDLELPYRVLQICSGDTGAGKYEMQDIETWMPSRNNYGETHSDSALTDWQARRLNIKYKTKDGDPACNSSKNSNAGKKKFAYTLNNTMIASPRILIAILENHQQKDGSVKIPKVLEKYLGFSEIKQKK